jgi:hypothetical protein
MEPAPGVEETSPQAPPDRKKWAVIGFIVVAAAVIAAVSLPGLLVKPPQGVLYPVSGTVPVTTVIPPAHGTLETTIPATPGATPTGQATPAPSSTPTPGGPPGFTVSIMPAEASGAGGETVVYHMTIEAQNGFSENISMQLEATALFVIKKTVDLGVQQPPYPKTIDYPFFIPADWPPGVTIDGVVRSTGGGITREDQLTLTVR